MEYVMEAFLLFVLFVYVLPFVFCMLFMWAAQIYSIRTNDKELLAKCEELSEEALIPGWNIVFVFIILFAIIYAIFYTLINLPAIIQAAKDKDAT